MVLLLPFSDPIMAYFILFFLEFTESIFASEKLDAQFELSFFLFDSLKRNPPPPPPHRLPLVEEILSAKNHGFSPSSCFIRPDLEILSIRM